MAQPTTKPADFNRALGDAKKQASGVADAFGDAAHEVYDQARESAADVVDTARTAARKTAGSFEQAICNTIENQPYTAAAIALGIGWLLGGMHRPLRARWLPYGSLEHGRASGVNRPRARCANGKIAVAGREGNHGYAAQG